MRRFEKLDDRSRKFWQVKRRGKTAWRKWGRVGARGRDDRTVFADAESARTAVRRWVEAKLRDDYFELGVGAEWGPNTPTPDIPTQRRALGELLTQEGLQAFEPTLQKLARPAILIDWRRHHDLPVGASKIGGRPDLPPAVAWPVYRNRPVPHVGKASPDTPEQERALLFVAQIRLADLRGLPDVGLPKSGLLSFFVLEDWQDTADEPWYLSECRVLYTSARRKLTRCDVPASFKRTWNGRPIHLPPGQCEARFLPTLSLPSADVVAKKKRMSQETEAELHELLYRDKRTREHGISLRDWQLGGFRKPYEERQDPMLLQCPSSHGEMTWGDNNYLTFFLSKRNLKAQRFDKVTSGYEE